MMFRDQVGILAGWFKGWNECEQTVALLSLLKRISRTQARFLQLCLEHSLADCTEIHVLESEANSAAVISQWHQEPKDKVVSLLLSHLPLLQPGNTDAKSEYMKLLQKVLAYSIESNLFIEESRQLLSYALIHPATTLDDRNSLALWLNHLEERLSSGYSGQSRGRPDTAYHSRQGSDEWQGPVDTGLGDLGHGWQEKPPRENGHMSFHSSGSVPSAINSIGSNANTALPCQIHPSPLKRSMSLIPTSQQVPSEWMSVDEMGARPAFIPGGEHAPLSPQSSVASSGSEQTEEQSGSRNTFQEEGSGMKDVPSWLKSLRLHKYAALFSQMTYEEMMTLTEQHLESQNVTKGARHKIALSIQKLRERQSVLKSLEKDILEGGNLWNALQELQQIIITPIKAFHALQAMAASKESQQQLPAEQRGATKLCLDKSGNPSEDKDPATDTFLPPTGSPCDGESGAAPIAEGDIAGQFTRVMGKVCTQLLVSRPDEENITSYLQLIEKCLMHEAFTETQKKRLLSWKQQVLKLLRTFPRKAVLDMQGYRPQKGTCGLPTPGAATACRARVAVLSSGPIRSPSTHPPRPSSCSHRVSQPDSCLQCQERGVCLAIWSFSEKFSHKQNRHSAGTQAMSATGNVQTAFSLLLGNSRRLIEQLLRDLTAGLKPWIGKLRPRGRIQPNHLLNPSCRRSWNQRVFT
uniref:Sterile alpha motif domain containing 4B n=1 Tax=Podarcis muralis TaxID=64176 RepID=A0A670JCI6_PODMU